MPELHRELIQTCPDSSAVPELNGMRRSLTDLKSDIEGPCVPLCLTGDLKDQSVSAASEDSIHTIHRGPTAPTDVGGLQVNFIRDRFFA